MRVTVVPRLYIGVAVVRAPLNYPIVGQFIRCFVKASTADHLNRLDEPVLYVVTTGSGSSIDLDRIRFQVRL